jgi:hypothetical protein
MVLVDTVHQADYKNYNQEGRPGFHTDVEPNDDVIEETEVSEDMQRVLRREDPDFQAPQSMPARASRSRAAVHALSPKKKSQLKKNVKKGTTTVPPPPIPPSNPGRVDPKPTGDVVPLSKPCWILHPDFFSQAVAYGKIGPHWKSKGQRLSAFCSHGQQMVQVHGVFAQSVPLMFEELERQPFRVLEDAVTLLAGSGVHIIWDPRYIVRYKSTTLPE